jgi:glycogen debranching enzyme
MSRAATIEGSNPIFNELARRSVSDVYMLSANTEHGPYPIAGIPWYGTPFGRDGIITVLLMLWLDPAIARGVLQFPAATQATTADAARDADPAKSCTRCVTERWHTSARCRSADITGRLMQHLCL